MDNHLYNAVMVTDIQKHNAAVVTDILYPAGYTHTLADIAFSQFTAVMGAVFVFFSHTIFPFSKHFIKIIGLQGFPPIS